MAEQIVDNPPSVETRRPSTRANVLVVDDRPDGLLALEAVLACEEYGLFKASSGQEALQQVLFNDFAVILLDVQMPEMDGFETARLIRENYRSKGTPIIFVTAINKEMRHIDQGYKSGAVDYIFKPFDPAILKSKVDIFVDLFQKTMQVRQQAALLREIELQEKERQIFELQQESNRRYTHLADAIPHSVIKLLPSGEVEYYNQRWLEFIGFKPDIDWEYIIHPQDKRKFLALWLRIRHHYSKAFDLELRLRSVNDGIYRWHLVRVAPEVKNGQNISWIASCTDIERIKKTEESLKVLSHELNRSNKELEEYAYVASHDLKEPLHVVSSFVYLFEKRFQPKLDEQERQYLKFIKDGVNQAQRLIKDLLEYSLIGRKKTFETVDMSIVLAEVLANVKLSVEDTKTVIRCGAMPRIKANYLDMVQLLQNLIVNAIKYRSQQPPEIDITVRPGHGQWLFAVKDNGIGIDPQFKERVFDMFQRLHGKNEYSGTGIGLAICKKIIETHGGKIWVDSMPGQGATFHFTIKQEI